MFRLFLSFQACWIVAALAQPTDARDSLIRPTNPPQPLPPQSGIAGNVPVQKPAPAPSLLKITGAEIEEAPGGSKKLKVAISNTSFEKADPARVRVDIYFYDADASGNTRITDTKIIPEWTSAPVNWSDGAVEDITFHYTAPSPDSGKKYAGYTFAIYYKDQLQDSRASSPDLLEKLPSGVAIASPAGTAPGAASPSSEPDRYLQAYRSFQEAEKAVERGDMDQAKGAVEVSVSMLEMLQTESPNWQPQIVDYRLAKAKALQTKINSK